MHFDDLDALQQSGFCGFFTVTHLHHSRCQDIPDERGIYLFLRLTATEPKFLEQSPVRPRKGKPSSVPVAELEACWVAGPVIVYIGKADGITEKKRLRTRVWQALRSGLEKGRSHWGGRYIWQLADANELVICWKPMPEGDPYGREQQLIQAFKDRYGKRPFANLQG